MPRWCRYSCLFSYSLASLENKHTTPIRRAGRDRGIVLSHSVEWSCSNWDKTDLEGTTSWLLKCIVRGWGGGALGAFIDFNSALTIICSSIRFGFTKLSFAPGNLPTRLVPAGGLAEAVGAPGLWVLGSGSVLALKPEACWLRYQRC